jgi:hypothetical protein
MGREIVEETRNLRWLIANGRVSEENCVNYQDFCELSHELPFNRADRPVLHCEPYISFRHP